MNDIPVVIDARALARCRPFDLGDRIQWLLTWNDRLSPEYGHLTGNWSIPATIDHTFEPGSAAVRAGRLSVLARTVTPVTCSLVLTGAVTCIGDPGLVSRNTYPQTAKPTAGQIRQIRRLSLIIGVHDSKRPTHEWVTSAPIAGTEVTYKLLSSPTALQSRALLPEEHGDARVELLLVDLLLDDDSD
ncbi:hypothetical protein [Aldersonia kunmingensis]|uniref:hypothetical protein n=1 Tax=Aldersonia kunmingensis TaxID=408066 RepID=UPI00082FCA00|nr:hypothetical protein [Aldersonia kunmingensis]